MPKTPTAARAALAAAVQAVRDHADARAQTEAAYELAVENVQKSWAAIAEIEAAIRDRPRIAAEDLLARAGRSTPRGGWLFRSKIKFWLRRPILLAT